MGLAIWMGKLLHPGFAAVRGRGALAVAWARCRLREVCVRRRCKRGALRRAWTRADLKPQSFGGTIVVQVIAGVDALVVAGRGGLC